MIPGMQIRSFGTALLATLVIGLVDFILGPILRFVAFPITFLTLGLFRLVINAVLLKLASLFTPGFRIDGFLAALLGLARADHPYRRSSTLGVGYPISVLAPSNSSELADALREAASAGQTIALAGNSTKRRMAGPIEPADVDHQHALPARASIQYEPHDLTISVEAGLGWRELTHLLAENRQMVPLDPPFAADATVGGVIAANSQRPSPAPLRHRARPRHRHALRHPRRQTRPVGRHGSQERRRARYGQAHDRLLRHARGHRHRQLQAPAHAAKSSAASCCPSLRSPDAMAARNRILRGQLAARGDRSAQSRGRRRPSAIRPGCWPCAPPATPLP